MQFKKSGIIIAFLLIAIVSSFIFSGSAGPALENVVAGDVTPDEFNYLPLIIKPVGTPTATATPLPPTATPTSSPTPADVRLTLIVYNPDGDDVAGEYVRLQNFGGTTAVLTGWTLSDNDGRVYTFPSFSLAAGANVLVWTKGGANNASNLYWGESLAVWTNSGDTAYLRNGGTLVDSCSYPGGGVQANC